ncbi:STAS domain-containing protein [Colwellia sp. 12G3]|uniref:STAS domain-containing protein n=1 Tax=Colwellia sp. 12G3 TaxID=2058299 RepID=UPI000C31DA39|nr:STAS domain-containing protein [Colwellia sp. 12G3]PKI16144.1 anti-anti-sigma factor [Colwellia sp. 12G3]
MTISSKLSGDGKKLVISIDERFDFSLHQQFRDAYTSVMTQNLTYVVDLSQTEYMDSSALGMILLLKDHVQHYAGQLIISKPSDTVRKILEIAQFQRLMTIE